MQNRQNLWQRLKPEYKKVIKQENKKYSYKMANIKQELKNKDESWLDLEGNESGYGQWVEFD